MHLVVQLCYSQYLCCIINICNKERYLHQNASSDIHPPVLHLDAGSDMHLIVLHFKYLYQRYLHQNESDSVVVNIPVYQLS